MNASNYQTYTRPLPYSVATGRNCRVGMDSSSPFAEVRHYPRHLLGSATSPLASASIEQTSNRTDSPDIRGCCADIGHLQAPREPRNRHIVRSCICNREIEPVSLQTEEYLHTGRCWSHCDMRLALRIQPHISSVCNLLLSFFSDKSSNLSNAQEHRP